MAWLGFSFAKKPSTPPAVISTASSSQSSRSSGVLIDADEVDGFDAPTAAPTVRKLTPAEVEKLQNENAQLKELLKQLSSRAQQQYPNLGPSASAPPAETDSATATSSPPLEFSFHRIHPSSSSSSTSPSAPPLDGSPTGAMDNFYDALRKSLAISSSASDTATSSVQPAGPSTVPESDLEEESASDEWGDDVRASPAVPDSLHAPRTEDEAIVYNKHGSVVIHKKPLVRPRDDEEDAPASGSTVAPRQAATELDDFDDEFGMAGEMTTAAAASLPEESAEEIAIFDVSQADWWQVVPHPDRVDEPLASAPPPPVDPAEDEDGFVVVKSKDSLAALGEFISGMMARHPECAALSPEQVRDMLESSLADRGLTTPTTAGQIWQIGKQAYTIWSYSAWGWSLYQDQTVLRMVASGVIKAASWTAVFLL